jgi:magnesium-transporting ATPase (P-type)
MCRGNRDGRESVRRVYGHTGSEWRVLSSFYWQLIDYKLYVGRGSGVAVATGSQTEFGVIFSMMQDVEERRTPLQNSMDELAKKLSILSFGIIGVICLIGVFQHRSWLEMFTIGGARNNCDLGR